MIGRWLREGRLWAVAAIVIVAALLPTTTVAASTFIYDAPADTRVDTCAFAASAVGLPQLSDAQEASASLSVESRGTSTTSSLSLNATNSLATGSDEAVFWSGIGRGGDATAASWAAKNGGATLESTLAQRGIQLPVWDASNPSVVSAWRQASADFASGASGNVRVLQGAPRIGSVWAEVEYPTLIRNPNVTSITSINPATGEQVVLWTRP